MFTLKLTFELKVTFNSLPMATSCSIKETNWLINKGMCVLLFDFLSIYYWEKLTFSKLVGKVNFLERKFEEMH